MRSEDRLARVMRGLDARERVLLLHQALIEDRAPDPQIRASIPPEQYAEFNHYVALANGVLHTLVAFALSLQAQVETDRMRLSFLLAIAGWGLERTKRGKKAGVGPSPPDALFPAVEPPRWAAGERPSMDDVTRAFALKQRLGIAATWAELRATEVVLDEVRAEFGGEEVAPDVLIEMLGDARNDLLQLHETSQPFSGPFELPDPNEAVAECLRIAVRRDEHLVSELTGQSPLAQRGHRRAE